jgi:hypothetical protein
MATIYRKGGIEISDDFVATITAHPQTRNETVFEDVNEDGETVQRIEVSYHATETQIDVTVPFENLAHMTDEQLATYGVTRVVVPDVPAQISDRQFFQQLALVGTITQDEALAAVATGAIPAALTAFINAIPDPTAQFNAKMLLMGATIFERNHPLTMAVAAAQGMTPEQVDGFFIAAAQL